MKTLNQICGAFVITFLLAFVLGFIAFQSAMFRDGMDELGVGPIGLGYFLGGLCVSLLFALMGGRKVPLVFFGVAIVAVGSLGLNQLLAGAYTPDGEMLNISRKLSQMGHVVALVLFWATPGISSLFYAYTRWEKYSILNAKAAQ